MAARQFNYTVILDYEHLDNGLFMKNLAESVSGRDNIRFIFLHGDSAYTERIMQTGVMREDAKIRSIRELNRRIVALLADNGIPSIGINGYQKRIIVGDTNPLSLQIDRDFFRTLPARTHVILSNLVFMSGTGIPYPCPLGQLAKSLQESLQLDGIIAFTTGEKPNVVPHIKAGSCKWSDLDENFKKSHIPKEIRDLHISVYITGTQQFRCLPDTKNMLLVSN